MKKLICILSGILLTASLCGCNNHAKLDLVYTFDRVMIELPNGEIIEGDVEKWSDYEGEQLQIRVDGVTYLVNSNNVVMIAE